MVVEDGQKTSNSIVRRIVLWLVILSVLSLVTVVTSFLLWATTLPSVGNWATEALSADARDDVLVRRGDDVTFIPAEANGAGFILYPGARVNPESYAYVAREIAQQGYTVFIPRLFLNLAVFESNAATGIMHSNASVRCWVVGGHSLGGAMAAQYAANNTSIGGLVLWAAYPAESNDLSDSGLAVTSIYGTLDGLATPERIEASRQQLPDDTVFVPIEGGNHAQFGDYGLQEGDNEADIPIDHQQQAIAEATVRFIQQANVCGV